MNDEPTPKERLALDTELIADLETDGDQIVGGLSGSAPPRSLGGSGSVGTLVYQKAGGELQAGC